jgi:coenzyme Q-binding protein COQ10
MLHYPIFLRQSLHHTFKATPTQQARTFLNIPTLSAFLPGSDNNSSNNDNNKLTLHATRTLPYARSALYTLVSDINSYPLFLPFCSGAKVLAYSRPDTQTGARHPALASLNIGWAGVQEGFVSRVFCVPQISVEAVAGEDQSCGLSVKEREAWGYEGLVFEGVGRAEKDAGGELFKSCRTKWVLRDAAAGRTGTEVDLKIDVEWKNLFYAAMSQAAAPKVAGVMVEAFEKRAREVLG